MTPVDMIVKHDPDNGVFGDCFRCCIASILEMPAADVPHFCHDGARGDGAWYDRLQEFLVPFDLVYVDFHLPAGPTEYFEHLTKAGVFVHHVLSGTSPRGFAHAVVARNGVMVHDPHPSREGVSRYEEGWSIGLLIRKGGA